jgi:hypothetical protein
VAMDVMKIVRAPPIGVGRVLGASPPRRRRTSAVLPDAALPVATLLTTLS